MTKTIYDLIGKGSSPNAQANGIEPNTPLVLKGDSDCMPPGSGHTIDPDNPVDDGTDKMINGYLDIAYYEGEYDDLIEHAVDFFDSFITNKTRKITFQWNEVTRYYLRYKMYDGSIKMQIKVERLDKDNKTNL